MGGRNRRCLLSLGLLLSLAPLSASAREVLIYVTDSGGDRVEAIDPTADKVVQVIGGIAFPHGIGFSPDGSQIYISNESKNVLDIVDRSSGQITDEVALSGRPNNIAVTKDGGRVLVAIRNGKGALDVIDTATRRLVKSILVNAPLHNVYVTPDGKYAIAGSIAGQMVTVIDLATDQPAWGVRFEAGVRPMAIEANPDGSTKRIFVELSEFHGAVIVDFAMHKGGADQIAGPASPIGKRPRRRDDALSRHRCRTGWKEPVDQQRGRQRGVCVFAARPAAPWLCFAAGAREIGATADRRKA
jgi:DNA-binding beta-propeller fold protein YncE